MTARSRARVGLWFKQSVSNIQDYGQGGWLCDLGTKKGPWFCRPSCTQMKPQLFCHSSISSPVLAHGFWQEIGETNPYLKCSTRKTSAASPLSVNAHIFWPRGICVSKGSQFIFIFLWLCGSNVMMVYHGKAIRCWVAEFWSSKFAQENRRCQELTGQQFDSHNTSQPCSGAPWTLSHQLRLILGCIREISVYHSYGTIQNWKENHSWFVYTFQLRMRRQGLPFVKFNYSIEDLHAKLRITCKHRDPNWTLDACVLSYFCLLTMFLPLALCISAQH